MPIHESGYSTFANFVSCSLESRKNKKKSLLLTHTRLWLDQCCKIRVEGAFDVLICRYERWHGSQISQIQIRDTVRAKMKSYCRQIP